MMSMFARKIKIGRREIFEFILFFLLIAFVVYLLRKFEFDSELVKEFVQSKGEFGMLMFVIYMMIATIFSPLNSLILFPVVYIAYDLWIATFLTFLGTQIGGVINFWIARRYGRPFLTRVAGKKAMATIDKFTLDGGWKGFLLVRAIGGNYYDYICYAAGLTSMSFLIYLPVTMTVSYLWILATYIIIGQAIQIEGINSVVLLSSSYMISLLGGVYVIKTSRKHK